MAYPDDLETTISGTAGLPAQVETDGLKTVQQDLDKLCRTDRYLAAKTAQTRKHRGLRFSKLVPPAAIGDTVSGGQSDADY